MVPVWKVSRPVQVATTCWSTVRIPAALSITLAPSRPVKGVNRSSPAPPSIDPPGAMAPP